MPKIQFAVPALLPILALLTVLCSTIQSSFGQNTGDGWRSASNSAPARSQPAQPANNIDSNGGSDSGDRDTGHSSAITFQGRIVRSANRLVLAAVDNTTYQLDNQQKAHNFLNQNVKVKGDLDATTGTIRIRAIAPV